ncbi:MAG: hypothetical protein RR925_09700 [Erysipelotrichaceae bacterium]
MNHKGSTLIEMVMAILIISIAGIMILGGFSATLRVMSNGNKIKNASDTMLSVAEKTNDAALNSKVNAVPSEIYYTINNVNNTSSQIRVKADLNTLNVTENKDIYLKSFQSSLLTRVKDTNEYITLMKNVEKLINKTKKAMNEREDFHIKYYTNTFLIDTYIWENEYQKNWDQFPTVLLPEALKSKVSATSPYFLKVSFPFDYYLKLDIGKPMDCIPVPGEGEMMIYIGLQGKSTTNIEQLLLMYNYKDGTWYYYPYPVEENDNIISYPKYRQSYIERTINANIGLRIGESKKYDRASILSYDAFITHIKTNGWLSLQTEEFLDANNSDNIWK